MGQTPRWIAGAGDGHRPARLVGYIGSIDNALEPMHYSHYDDLAWMGPVGLDPAIWDSCKKPKWAMPTASAMPSWGVRQRGKIRFVVG